VIETKSKLKELKQKLRSKTLSFKTDLNCLGMSPRIVERIRKVRMEYGPIIKMLEDAEGPIVEILRNRPVLQKLFEPRKLDAYDFLSEADREIARSRSEDILILSPFTYRDRVEEFKSILETALNNGSHITIHTLTPSSFKEKRREYYQAQNIETLKKAGATVIERKNMHEKAVIIGNRIAYLGSTNFLSKSKKAAMESPGDYMLKYTIPDLVITFRKFLEELWKNSEKSTL